MILIRHKYAAAMRYILFSKHGKPNQLQFKLTERRYEKNKILTYNYLPFPA